jgi:hypothetical protein
MMMKTRKWTTKNLREDDYRFAISSDHQKWNCLATQLWTGRSRTAQGLAEDIFIWELWREISDAPSFLSSEENRERVEKAKAARNLKPAEFPPLKEIPVDRALRFEKARQEFVNNLQNPGGHRLIWQGMSVHAFLISRDEMTEDTVCQFRNWLVKFKSQPDPRVCMSMAKKIDIRFREGRKSIDALLCALAVRRLKMAGFSREDAERKLNLKRYLLARPTNQWNKLPKKADRLIADLIEAPLAFGGSCPFGNSAEKLPSPSFRNLLP